VRVRDVLRPEVEQRLGEVGAHRATLARTGSTAAGRLGPMAVTGLLLAAGAGRRMGGPKGLLRHPDGTPWVARAAGVLQAGGCASVLVVLGAAAAEVRELVPVGVRSVLAADWAQGMGASLRTGLDAVASDEPPADDGAADDGAADDGAACGVPPVAVLVTLVDLPGVTAEVVTRLLAHASPSVLARAGYSGAAGHPVLIGREHWAGVAAAAAGDAGARAYLHDHAADVVQVECGDVGSGHDLDAPADLPDAPPTA
jgi:CTP:molybdopterin cytidylyltransferase MocA